MKYYYVKEVGKVYDPSFELNEAEDNEFGDFLRRFFYSDPDNRAYTTDEKLRKDGITPERWRKDLETAYRARHNLPPYEEDDEMSM